jgi:hypothetical protein
MSLSREFIKELKNIPISLSLLHEQEYNNLCSLVKRRRASSEKYRIHKSLFILNHFEYYDMVSNCYNALNNKKVV